MNIKLKARLLLALLISIISLHGQTKQQWTAERANTWYKQYKWLNGANYIPSNAINQLEMWQADTFSPELIDKELMLAKSIGFNVMRVFLHSMVWEQDPNGFRKRIDQFLSIASKNSIQIMFVFFDDCWNSNPKPGKQPDPVVGKHNSGWVQDPGDMPSDETTFTKLEKYVKDILNTFGNDRRILLWDLYNEPGNSKKENNSLPLLKKVFEWAREINPTQPLTAGFWSLQLKDINTFILTNSDVITYHSYENPLNHRERLLLLKAMGRPVICTEYMARSINSRFSNIMPMLKSENVGAINWGLVQGKTNTIYGWEHKAENNEEPDEWFHDIYRSDFTPYRKDEIDLIKKLNHKR